MRKPFGPVQFGQPTLDFRQEDEPLYRVIDRGVCRHGLQHFDDPISGEWLLHDVIVIQTFVPSLGGSKPSAWADQFLASLMFQELVAIPFLGF